MNQNLIKHGKPKTTDLVPVDFTPTAERAIRFAIELAETSKAEIFLLHIYKSEDEKIKVDARMNAFVEKYSAIYDNLRTKVIEGSLPSLQKRKCGFSCCDLLPAARSYFHRIISGNPCIQRSSYSIVDHGGDIFQEWRI